MKKSKILLAATMLLYASSCSVQQMPELLTNNNYSDARVYEPRTPRIAPVPLVVDIELVSPERITYTETFVDIQANDLSRIESMAKANAALKYNADMIIAPLIKAVEIKAKRFENVEIGDTEQLVERRTVSYTITVIGYPAKYVNFRNATPKDDWILDRYENVHIKTKNVEPSK